MWSFSQLRGCSIDATSDAYTLHVPYVNSSDDDIDDERVRAVQCSERSAVQQAAQHTEAMHGTAQHLRQSALSRGEQRADNRQQRS